MPDADDFDVEYFRNLLKGNSPAAGREPPAEPSPRAEKKPTRGTPRATSGKSGKAPGDLKKLRNR